MLNQRSLSSKYYAINEVPKQILEQLANFLAKEKGDGTKVIVTKPSEEIGIKNRLLHQGTKSYVNRVNFYITTINPKFTNSDEEIKSFILKEYSAAQLENIEKNYSLSLKDEVFLHNELKTRECNVPIIYAYLEEKSLKKVDKAKILMEDLGYRTLLKEHRTISRLEKKVLEQVCNNQETTRKKIVKKLHEETKTTHEQIDLAIEELLTYEFLRGQDNGHELMLLPSGRISERFFLHRKKLFQKKNYATRRTKDFKNAFRGMFKIKEEINEWCPWKNLDKQMNVWYPQRMSNLLTQIALHQRKFVKNNLEELMNAFLKPIMIKKYFLLGDTHTRNIMKKNECYFIDFSQAKRGHWMLDVAELITDAAINCGLNEKEQVVLYKYAKNLAKFYQNGTPTHTFFRSAAYCITRRISSAISEKRVAPRILQQDCSSDSLRRVQAYYKKEIDNHKNYLKRGLEHIQKGTSQLWKWNPKNENDKEAFNYLKHLLT